MTRPSTGAGVDSASLATHLGIIRSSPQIRFQASVGVMPPGPRDQATTRGPEPLESGGLRNDNGEGSSFRLDTPANTSPDQPKQGKKKHRAGRKRRNRRQSFAAPSDTAEGSTRAPGSPILESTLEHTASQGTGYTLGLRAAVSNESIESEALLDHRSQAYSRPRRPSTNTLQQHIARGSQQTSQSAISRRPQAQDISRPSPLASANGGADETMADDRTPLLHDYSRATPGSRGGGSNGIGGFSSFGAGRPSSNPRYGSRKRQESRSSSLAAQQLVQGAYEADEYDVNNPPSVPGSPSAGALRDYDDVLLPHFHHSVHSPERTRSSIRDSGEHIVDIDRDASTHLLDAPRPDSPRSPAEFLTNARRRQMVQTPAEDVCLPFEQDALTDVVDDDPEPHMGEEGARHRHKRRRPWPDLDALDEWAAQEKEEQSYDGVRAKKVDEPVLVGGRLRPQKKGWRREEEEAPFRFTYFNEELDSSLKSRTLSGLQQLGSSFRELFIPDLPELESSSSSEEEDDYFNNERGGIDFNGHSRAATRQSSVLDPRSPGKATLEKTQSSGDNTPSKDKEQANTAETEQKPKRYGQRPVFWLDVLQPTYEEMRTICRAFGIHKLTAEDIMEQEAREKVELFRSYYFVNYRTFEQDDKSPDFMNAVNMYFVVFKGGVLSFHFSQMPHPPNVRRRIRQLAEHQYTDCDWIAYAIIDNITDAFAPLIEQIESEVDDIDDAILRLHSRKTDGSSADQSAGGAHNIRDVLQEKLKRFESADTRSIRSDSTLHDSDRNRDMLLRVGECRKKVMSLYRLLGNKADVIKGLAKRSFETAAAASPRSDVGLYLGDIQDHIVTMTGNLTHYENILARAHSNYLAQINIGMNERAEQTADVLGKLTVLGTIVLPMNIVTGLWGMNCLVPGQDVQSLWWFFGLTGFLFAFGFACFFIAKKVYRIV